MMIPHNNSRGYILECDLGKYYFYYLYTYTYLIKCNVTFLCISEYPHELHDLHKDYPLTPEGLQIEESILSDYQRHLLQDEGFSKPQTKLIPNLPIKMNYTIHYRNLKLYLELGMHLTNVHRVLLFDQSSWLKNYINFNTCQRTAAKKILKKISLSWWATQTLVSLLHVYLFLYIDSFIAGKVFTFMLICSYVLIHWLQAKLLSLWLFVLRYS